MEQDRLRTTALEETPAPSFRFADTHEGSRVLENTGNFLPGYTVSHHRRKFLYCHTQVCKHQGHKRVMICICSVLTYMCTICLQVLCTSIFLYYIIQKEN